MITLMYAVADAIDVACERGSPALRREIAGAQLLLKASYGGLVGVARKVEAGSSDLGPHAGEGTAAL